MASLLRKGAEIGRRQAAHGLTSKASRTAGGQGYRSQVNKAFLPHIKKINRGGGAGRGRVNCLKFNQPNKELNKALYLLRMYLPVYKPFKPVNGCTGKLCRHSICHIYKRFYKNLHAVWDKAPGTFPLVMPTVS